MARRGQLIADEAEIDTVMYTKTNFCHDPARLTPSPLSLHCSSLPLQSMDDLGGLSELSKSRIHDFGNESKEGEERAVRKKMHEQIGKATR